MQNAKTIRKLLSLLLILAMLGTLLVPAVSADPGTEQKPAEEAQLTAASEDLPEDEQKEEPYAPDDMVRVSIFLEDPAPIDAGYSMEHVSKNTALISYRNQLKAKQDDLHTRIEKATGTKLALRARLTLLANVISMDVRYGDVETIERLSGVKSVCLEHEYEVPDPVDETPVEPNTAKTSSYMVGATDVWAEGYTGAGSRIAIIDTGLDGTHQSFDGEAFEYAIAQTGKDIDLFTQADLNAIKSQLSISNPQYLSSKVPFAYNYADQNTNYDHLNDVQGEHGSHVAGIAAANRYLKSGSSFVDAAETVGAVGMAPDAQLFIMKVFGNMGAYESIYVEAIEDAITMDCDVVNLSLGSGNPGFVYSEYYQHVWANVANMETNTKMVVSISAGNSYSFADFLTDDDGNKMDLYIDDVNMHTGGDPGAYINSLCVASAENLFMKGYTLLFNGSQNVFYNETESSGAKMKTIAGSYSYVYIDAPGNADDYSAVNAVESLSGKIVIVNRGSISFADKGNNAKTYNPKGMVVANNVSGGINMLLTDYTGSFPMVSMSLEDAETLKANSTAHTAGSLSYYTGTVTVNGDEITTQVSTNPEMSTFSSWGVPGALLMKPEITAPGGNIYSVFGKNQLEDGGFSGGSDQYELMSGTSMAAPHIAGLTGTLGQYLRENNISIEGKTTRQIVQSLLMSTAVPMHKGGEDGCYYPILQQGAGLVNVRQAVHASSFLFMNADATMSYADGKVKAELGDKPSRSGNYTWSFNIYNTADQAQTYALSTDLFTQDRYLDDDGNAHMAKTTTALNWPVSYSTGSSVTVPAHGSKSITVTISIPADMSEFDALYPSGAYVEGYTYVESQTATADGALLDVRHSIPILGFYGSWTDPNMFNNVSYVDAEIYGDTRSSYSESTDTNYMTYSRGSSSATKYVTGNPYFTETPFPADRLAMRPSDTIKQIKYTLIRFSGTTGYGVSKIDDDGSVLEVLKTKVDTNGTRVWGMYYSTSAGSWQGDYSMSYSPLSTFESYGAVAGDRIRVGYYAIPEYNAMKVNEDLEASTAGILTDAGIAKVLKQNVLGKGAMIGYDFYMDETAPVILSAVRTADNTVEVTVRDDNWIAKLALLDGATTVAELIPEQSVRGQTVTYSFDISGISDPSNLSVFVGDYAANEATRTPEVLLYSISAYSNNPAWGSVEVMGGSIVCTPAEGYYVQDAQVLTGTAEPEINGNVITVNPGSDCSIQVIFAARPVITLQYMVNGELESTVSGYLNDSVKLPEVIQSTNFTEDYSFIGWYGDVLLETQEAPTYYLPGQKFTLTEDTTLYALFQRFEGNNGEVFNRLTNYPENIEGRYVITSGYTASSFMLPTIGNEELYKDHANQTKISSSGATITGGTVLTDVPLTNVFTVAKTNESGYYSIESVSMAGTYLADTSSGLSTRNTVSNFSKWTIQKMDDMDSYDKFRLSSQVYDTYGLFLNSTNVWSTTRTTTAGVYLWKGEPTGTQFFTTNPVPATHVHELTHYDAVAPTCGEAGNIEYWRCGVCGKYFSDANAENEISASDVVVAATGEHDYTGAVCTSNNNGTHTHTCTVCGHVETENCTYEDVVTPPTQTSQGYTTHTCIHCGYSFVDSYVPALGNTFTVTFSVFGNTTVIAPMECNTSTGITLPTAQAPEGYKFLGWVTGNYDNVTARPDGILNGNYVAAENITLYALFSRVEGGTGELVYTLQTEAPADWTGRWVITRGKTGSFYVLTGIAAGSYESNASGGATGFVSSGMTLEDNVLSNVSEKYVFEVESKGGNYAIKNAEKNTYLAEESLTLTAVNNYAASTCDWVFSMNQYGDVNVKNANATSYPYIGCSSYFMCTVSSGIDLSLWCETPSGTVYYTTVQSGEHVHTVAHHEEEPATCTENGVKAYYYCSDPNCPLAGKKFEDAALTVEITDVVIPALGHSWGAPGYSWSDDNSSVTASRSCQNDNTHVETETVATSSVVTVAPSYEQEGEIVYTAVFQNAAFATQTKTVVLPMLTLPCDGENCPGKIFTDMPAKEHWAHNAIDWALVKHITAGTSATTFGPTDITTRAQVVTFLWRAAGSPEPASMNNPFTDVPAGSYYEKAVLWAVENEITAGIGNNAFGPKMSCTRAQIVTFLWHFAGSPAPESETNPFQDVSANAYYAAAVLWARENGITAGTSETSFSPDAVCTRAQVVTFLYRLLGR